MTARDEWKARAYHCGCLHPNGHRCGSLRLGHHDRSCHCGCHQFGPRRERVRSIGEILDAVLLRAVEHAESREREEVMG